MRSASKALVILAAGAVVALTLTGRGLERPATASNQSAESRFATVDSIGLLEQMLQTEQYQSVRDTSRTTFETQMAKLQTMNSATVTLLQNTDQNDPSYQSLVMQYQNQQSQMQALGSQFGQEIDTIAAEQATEIYKTITAAVNAVAEREGIDHVFSNRTAPDSDLALGLAGVTQQILARPLVRTNALDLTVAVREEMGLPDPAIAAAEAAAEAAAAEARRAERAKEMNDMLNGETGDAQAEQDEGAEEEAADDDG